MPHPTFKARAWQQREQEILDAAVRLMQQRGAGDLRMEELAENVGISKPTLYQHFKSKEDLISQVLLRELSSFEDDLEMHEQHTPLEHLHLVMHRILKAKYVSGTIMGNVAPEHLVMLMRSDPRLIEHRARATAQLAELVEAAKKQHQITHDIPTPIIVRSMFCLTGALRDVPPPGDPAYDENSVERAIEHVIHMLFMGITPRTTPVE